MVIEPFVRMGPPPRSLAAEANDCFMVRPDPGQPNTRVRREFSRAMAGSPRFAFHSAYSRRGSSSTQVYTRCLRAGEDTMTKPTEGNPYPFRSGGRHHFLSG